MTTETKDDAYRAAKRAGQKRYVSSTPCAKCGSVEKYVCNRFCVVCAIAAAKARSAKR